MVGTWWKCKIEDIDLYLKSSQIGREGENALQVQWELEGKHRAYDDACHGDSGGVLTSCPGSSKCYVEAQSSELRTWWVLNECQVGLVQV